MFCYLEVLECFLEHFWRRWEGRAISRLHLIICESAAKVSIFGCDA